MPLNDQAVLLGWGRISSDDMRKWIKTLIENGGDTSRLDESWLQKGNAMFGQNFRSARQLMEEVLNAGKWPSTDSTTERA